MSLLKRERRTWMRIECICRNNFSLISKFTGCTDGTTETLIADSWLSGCMGAWSGHIYNASHLCASGWRVCSWEDNRMLKKLKWEKASNVEGCFAYNAAQDSGGCGPCANHIDQVSWSNRNFWHSRPLFHWSVYIVLVKEDQETDLVPVLLMP